MDKHNDKSEVVLLSHGNGGSDTRELVELFSSHFQNQYLQPLYDSALLPALPHEIAMTTDSYVVKPYKFPGGDIGKLAVCGTINDLAVAGSRPLFITCALIIEEGMPLAELNDIAKSIAETANMCGIQIVAGDTKVVEHGKADSIYINTSGIGTIYDGVKLGYERIQEGDVIIINGTIGDHGMAIMAARNNLTASPTIKSDCTPLHSLVEHVLSSCKRSAIKFMRDPTRGGLAASLHEIASSSKVTMEIDELSLPIKKEVKVLSEILGIDPLYTANEGKLIMIVDASDANQVLNTIQSHPDGREAAIIGKITATGKSQLLLTTSIGTKRVITPPTGTQLPRIC